MLAVFLPEESFLSTISNLHNDSKEGAPGIGKHITTKNSFTIIGYGDR